MRFTFFLTMLLAAAAPAVAIAAGGGNGGGEVDLGGDCKIDVPKKDVAVQPKPEWYEKFKQAWGEDQGPNAQDQDRWKAKDRPKFDTCAAFKVLMGICWKESGLNPAAGPGADAIASPGMCQIQQRNCDGVGVKGNLNDPLVTVECAAKIMKKNVQEGSCITVGADQKGNGKCLTNWSVMICNSNNKVGHREEIRDYVAGDKNCQ